MAIGAYIGKSDSSVTRCKQIYIGDENNNPKLVKRAYIGDENGNPKLVYSSTVKITFRIQAGCSAVYYTVVTPEGTTVSNRVRAYSGDCIEVEYGHKVIFSTGNSYVYSSDSTIQDVYVPSPSNSPTIESATEDTTVWFWEVVFSYRTYGVKLSCDDTVDSTAVKFSGYAWDERTARGYIYVREGNTFKVTAPPANSNTHSETVISTVINESQTIPVSCTRIAWPVNIDLTFDRTPYSCILHYKIAGVEYTINDTNTTLGVNYVIYVPLNSSFSTTKILASFNESYTDDTRVERALTRSYSSLSEEVSITEEIQLFINVVVNYRSSGVTGGPYARILNYSYRDTYLNKTKTASVRVTGCPASGTSTFSFAVPVTADTVKLTSILRGPNNTIASDSLFTREWSSGYTVWGANVRPALTTKVVNLP